MNNCSKIKCPLNALTFKDCNLTEKECCYFTKQPTNGDVIKAMFPNEKIIETRDTYMLCDTNGTVRIIVYKEVWNALYKGGGK